MRELDARYGLRLKAVKDAVAAEFGTEEANRGYITTLPCYGFRWDVDRKRAVDRAVNDFDQQLTVWEKRYRLRGTRRN